MIYLTQLKNKDKNKDKKQRQMTDMKEYWQSRHEQIAFEMQKKEIRKSLDSWCNVVDQPAGWVPVDEPNPIKPFVSIMDYDTSISPEALQKQYVRDAQDSWNNIQEQNMFGLIPAWMLNNQKK